MTPQVPSQRFAVPELLAGMNERPWLEFLRVSALSVGLYRLKAGETDRQSLHTEDEVYYVLAGRATFHAGDRDREVGPGDLLYVQRRLDHRFFNIREDLTLLVFFAPAEGSQKSPAP